MAFTVFAGYTKFIKILGNKQTRSLTLKDASNLDGWMDDYQWWTELYNANVISCGPTTYNSKDCHHWIL